jgi:ABC-type bacteriocin/lantibiotic exporter with double-glycine peptidase domain
MIDMTDKLTPMQRFWRLLVPDKKEIRNVYVYAVFNGLVSLSLPLGIQAIINLIQGGRISTAWVVLVSFVVAGVAAAGVLSIMQLRITENLQQRIFARASFEFAYRIPRFRMSQLYKHYAPELVNRFFDIMTVQKGLSKILIEFSSAALQVIFGLILLSLYHPFFILFGLILMALVYAIFRFTAARGLATSLEESKHKYKLVHWLEEVARTSMTFKMAGATELALKKTDKHTANYLSAREAHFGVLVRQYSLLVAFKVFVAAGLLIIGGILVMDQRMNIGQFVAAEIIILLVMASVEKLIVSLETIYDVLTSLEKVGQVTDMEVEQGGSIDLVPECKNSGLSVIVESVSFHYPDRSMTVLNELSLAINCGEKVMLSGRSASGKSTVMQLLAGIYKPASGTVSFNGVPIGNIKLESLRSVIGDCMSDELLFEGTLLENILIGRPGLDLSDAMAAVEIVGLAAFVRGLPKGYDTILDPQGRRLPGSVTKKIILARSIACRPSLLLIEDDFEEIDAPDRQRFIDHITDKNAPWTLVIVSNDARLAAQCDRVIVLDKGKVGVEGPYQIIKYQFPFRNNGHA